MSRTRLIAAATALSLTVAAWGVHAWGSPARDALKPDELHPIHLKQATLYLTKETRSAAQSPAGEGQRALYIVQFTGPIQESYKSALVRAGAEVGDYLPENSYVVRMGDQTKQLVQGLGFVRSIGRYEPAYKVDPALASVQGEAQVRVTTFNGSSKAPLGTLTSLGLKPLSLGLGSVTTMATGENVQRLSESADIVYIEPVRKNALFNDKAAGIMGLPTVWGAGLTGAGQVVAVADTGLDKGKNDKSLHADFQGQVATLYAWGRSNDSSDTHGHGTHVAGSILGTGAASGGQNKGMAPGAKLVFQSVGDAQGGLSGIPSDIAQLFRQGYQAGARIHSNSWGVPATAGGAGVYDGQAAAADRFIWENSDFAILFAAGNDGDHDQDGSPNYGTVSTPSTAKNVITVGASENLRPDRGRHADNATDVALFSSRGLTKDGRVKPDVVTPGTWILSTKSSLAPASNFWAAHNDQYAFMGGTSMATPLTAGTVALARQYYTEQAGITPKASLLKATLINGAVSMGSNVSAKDQGWGRVDLKNTLYPGDGRGFKYVNEDHALATGDGQTFQYTVAPGAPFKATLVWTDYPAAPAADKTLVNDLDLTVTGPDGKVVMGNHMLGGTVDRTNNVENVVIAQPQAGTYTVTVKAHNVPQGPQRFALVVSGKVDGGSDQPTPPPADPKPEPPGDDKEVPVVSLKAPQGGTVRGTVSVEAEATDNVGVSKVDLFANGEWIGSASSAPYRFSWDTTKIKDGTYSLVANAYDAAGNVGKSSPVTVTVTNQSQQVSDLTQVFTSAAGTQGALKRYYVDMPAAGSMSLSLKTLRGSASMGVSVYDPAGKVIGQSKTGEGAPSLDLNNLPGGTYTIVVQNLGGWADYALTVRHSAAPTAVTATQTGGLNAMGTRFQTVAVTLGAAGALNASVTGHDGRADLDLYLVDGLGRTVAQATSPNLNPETVSARVAPGKYTLYVVADSGRSDFTLTVNHPK